ncbi:glycoside hydrolase family 97 protein [Chryseolinea lacunae]|uniref:Glycoside hydrolase family 97 protein n=1 Tax=Chryseolinea lacunae TaxID=2801331 RepID=A0ABS1KYP7_9BACT|nr:glycoside hydrolase family 97 protein [Chryseolinea lacunae]MBL0744455.1 glycoside hydrolase family 97 protein [Chryseolinea lacunae]
MKAFYVVLLIFLFALIALTGTTKDRPVEVSSPNGKVTVQFELKDGVPFYSVLRNKVAVLNPSALGFVLKDLPALNKDFKIVSSTPASFNETWTQVWGEAKTIRNQYNSLTLALEERSNLKRKLNIIFKVYNDGIGFRYEIPAQPNLKNFVILDELTEFALAQDLSAWWIPTYGNDIDSEYLFTQNNVSELKETVNTPLTLSAGNKNFVSIHEAALVDYASMALVKKGHHTLKADLVPWANGNRVEAAAPLQTPWRTIQLGDTPGDLVTSYLILNLNEPNKLADVSWIKPGKYNGMWWGMHLKTFTWEGGPHHGATTANMKELIDFASTHHLSATLAEGWNEGWEGDWTKGENFNFTKPYSDYDLAEVSRYAHEKNVGIIAHHETGGNIANYEKQLEDAFKLCAQYDIHRLKTGYVNRKPAGELHQGQFMVRHYQKVMEMAAKYKVMLDVHEPIKDTGLRRTYPNMMTREGGRGTEYEAWSTGNPPAHTTIIPFTRCLGGPFDYTPGIFDIQFKTDGNFRVHTTLAKQLALYVVIYSPMHMAADLPQNYEGKPAFKFIEDVPTDWDDTKVLNAEIGKYVTTARKDRNSNDWFVGSITNEDARTLPVKLDFLTPGKKYTATIYQDGNGADMVTNPLPLDIVSKEVDATTVLDLKLAPGGGAAIRFQEKP